MDQIALLNDVLNYIELHLCESITAQSIAKNCYCSRTSLQNLFEYISGYHVKEYITKRRLSKAARELLENPKKNILEIAVSYCYGSNESFTRAFEQIYHCTPSEYRKRMRYSELYPRLYVISESEDGSMRSHKQLEISELYDFFRERKDCYFICCDVQNLIGFNQISRKAGDCALLETMNRLNEEAGQEDVVFRIGPDEFVVLTNKEERSYAEEIADRILARNGEMIGYENQKLPLSLYVAVDRYNEKPLRYHELFQSMHQTIEHSKSEHSCISK